MNWNWRRPIIWAIKVDLALLAIDILALPVSALFLEISVSSLMREGFFPMLLLFEAGILFLAGGLIAMSSSIFPSKIREHVLQSGDKWSKEKHRKSEAKANQYILVGAILFIESLFSTFLVL